VTGATPNKYMRDVTYSEAPPTITTLPHPAHALANNVPPRPRDRPRRRNRV
jgi:hypothetical protein